MFQKIFPNIYAFVSENSGSNVFLLIGKKEIALIDSGTEGNKQALIEGLASLDLKPEDISLVLYTHGHADHFGLDFLFTNAKRAMHKFDAEQINSGKASFACSSFFPGTKFPKISILLEPNQEIDLGKIKLKCIHTPGHTEGSICFFEQEKGLLFSGDTVFAEGFGRTDLPSGNATKMAESLKKLQKMGFKGLFPGHGPFLLGQENINLAP